MSVAGARIPRESRHGIVLSTALLTLVALVVPMAGVAVANHGTRTLQLTPEADDNPIATTHTVTATLDAAADATIQIDFEVNGPGDPDTPDAYSPTSPDFTCDITSGNSSCTISYLSTVVGTDQIDGWIDHDKDNATLTGELDQAEGPDAGNPAVGEPSGGVDAPGGTAEPDTTDVVTKTWVTALPAGTVLDCDDA